MMANKMIEPQTVTANASSRFERWRAFGGQVLRGIADLVYPPSCHVCNQPLAGERADFCETCRREFIQDEQAACGRCATTVGPFSHSANGCLRCRNLTFHFDAAVRLGKYEGRLREAVLRMKHYSGENVAYLLGRLWAGRCRERFRRLQPDWIIPVPLYWLRRIERGYNQAGTLAQALSETTEIPCRSRWLIRTRHTPHQTGQSQTARQKNVHGAFFAHRRPELQGKTVLLVDDVMSTGSTCSEAARALRAAGAKRIIVAVLARSENSY